MCTRVQYETINRLFDSSLNNCTLLTLNYVVVSVYILADVRKEIAFTPRVLYDSATSSNTAEVDNTLWR